MVKEKVPVNYVDALSSIQGQLDQLQAELEETKLTGGSLMARVKSIKNALKEITP